MDFALYWFMFPVAILVSTVAMLSGIAGAAIFMPVFLLVFPLLGNDYILASPVAAIASALLTSTFGFSSGFLAYRKKGLIDFELARSFLCIAAPLAVIGALVAQYIDPVQIRLFYGVLMIAIVAFLLFGDQLFGLFQNQADEAEKLKQITDANGKTYKYPLYKAKWLPTSIGGFLTGLLSTGIGEVTVPQLVKLGKVEVAIAAGTSVLVVFICFICASVTHCVTLISEGGIKAVPWHLVCYTIPGVIIGGQIGPRLQNKVPSKMMVRAIAIVFLGIGLAMIWTVIQ